jgi:hypothetical protein
VADIDPNQAEWRLRRATNTMACLHVESGSVLLAGVDDHGTLRRTVEDVLGPDGPASRT